MDNEIWVPIRGYEDLYLVSNLGRVKSLGRDVVVRGIHKVSKSRILKSNLNNVNGYLTIYLFKDGSRKKYFIHRLVAEHFVEKLLDKKVVDHINGIKTDNRSNNLRWVDYFENSCGNPNTPTTPNKSVLQFDLNGNFIKEFPSINQASRELNLNQANITHCLKGKYQNSGGFIWRYK